MIFTSPFRGFVPLNLRWAPTANFVPQLKKNDWPATPSSADPYSAPTALAAARKVCSGQSIECATSPVRFQVVCVNADTPRRQALRVHRR